MEVRGQEITSICLMNVEDDGSIVGTVVNEMGVKAFDFTYANGKAKVINVLGPLNKWYIRMVLRKDFSFILSNIDRKQNVVHKKRSMTVTPEGDIVVRNDKYNIRYTFTPMKEDHETDQ
jgi:translation initiation factor IF-1